MYYTTDEQIERMCEELRLAKEKRQKKGSLKPLQKINIQAIVKVTGLFIFIIVVISLLFILYSVLMAKSRGETPDVLGYQLYVVKSNSMAPTLDVGTVILSKIPEDSTKLDVNDIVTFKTISGAVVTHRIIEVIETGDGKVKYRTKGDNPTNSPDTELLDPERVMAKFVLKIPLT